MRHSPRLPTFDYSTSGAYSVTVATKDRARLFGQLNGAASIDLSDAGRMVERWWREVPKKYPTVQLDAFVVMPDHFHGIVLLNITPTSAESFSVPVLMQWFKSMSTNEYFRRVTTDGWPRVNRQVWQRSYYDRIIRNELELIEIRTYIETNPGALYERQAWRTHRSAPTTSSTG